MSEIILFSVILALVKDCTFIVIDKYYVTPRPGEVDTWQPSHTLEWVLVSQAPFKDSQSI